MKQTLRPYQRRAADAIIAHVRASTEPCLIEAATGAGKSLIIADVAHTIHKMSGGKHILCLAPSAELVQQNREKYLALGEPASMFSASAGGKSLRHPVVFATPGTVKNAISRFGSKFSAVVIDECFTAGTMIETTSGPKPVEFVRSGDYVYNACGVGVVTSTMARKSENIYRVSLSNGKTIRCTGNHPFFTGMGWKSASAMERGEVLFRVEDMPLLWSGVSTKEVQAQGEEKYLPGKRAIMGEKGNLQSVLCKEIQKPDAQRGEPDKDVCKVEGNRSRAKDYWRKWQRPNSSSIKNGGSPWTGMGNGIVNSNKSRASERSIPKPLQGRLGEQGENDCCGARWRKSSVHREAGSGREKDKVTDFVRVESVSIDEQGRGETVYNLSVGGHPSYFAEGVLVHNCHGITPTIKTIISCMRDHNENLRVIGLTATPYRLNEGYIFSLWPDDKPVAEYQRLDDPYFLKMVDQIQARELIDMGYLTPPLIGAPLADSYDTSNLALNRMGKFDAAEIDRAFVGQGRKTAAIIGDIVEQARDRMGVMIFAATVQHAEECMASLPPHNSALVTGGTAKADRASILKRFKDGQIKYLVNICVLTTGFDAERVDVVALLRRTESVGLLQQIIGRGLRLHPEKRDCLVLDYADNIGNHCPDGDLFKPEIQAKRRSGEMISITACCPQCHTENEFAGRPNPDELRHDKHGYFVDLAGQRIETEHGPMPAHYGRRCFGVEIVKGKAERCTYRWTGKSCPHCDADVDIAARYCPECKGEIVDPARYLDMRFRELKKDPYQPQCDEVIKWDVKDTVSQSGNETYRVDITTPYRSFSVWILKEPKNSRALHQLELLNSLHSEKPDTIKYVKEQSGFFRLIGFNMPHDQNEADQTLLGVMK